MHWGCGPATRRRQAFGDCEVAAAQGPARVDSGLDLSRQYCGLNCAASIDNVGPVEWNIRQSLDDLPQEGDSTRAVIRAGAVHSPLPQWTIYDSRRRAVRHTAIGYFAEGSVVILNGFDCEVVQPSPEARLRLGPELGLGADTTLVGLIAHFHPMKNHEIFFGQLSSRPPATQIYITFSWVIGSSTEMRQCTPCSKYQM